MADRRPWRPAHSHRRSPSLVTGLSRTTSRSARSARLESADWVRLVPTPHSPKIGNRAARRQPLLAATQRGVRPHTHAGHTSPSTEYASNRRRSSK
jgi:hypothetical protein